MTIKTFDKAACRIVRDGINEAVKAFAEENGITIHAGNISYQESTLTCKVEVSINNEDGTAFDKYAEDFKKAAEWNDFDPEDLGKEFKAKGQTYRIVGWNKRARKRPVHATSRGKTFVFAEDAVLRALGRKKPELRAV